jgi:predicted NBD/HSP70 family sugar kinase
VSKLSPVQPQLLSRINEALVLKAFRQRGPSTRVELSQHLGVTFPTVAKAVGNLVDARLIEEFDDIAARPGRPAKRLRLAREQAQVIGLSVDGNQCEIAAAGFDGVVRESTREVFTTPASYEEMLTTLAERIKAHSVESATVLAIGVSLAGLVDYRQQQARLSARLPFLSGKRLGHDLAQLVGIECVLVRDAHALCLAEYVYGAARDLETFVVIDLCTGIGMGVMSSGVLLTGHSGFAGELGHIPIVAAGAKCCCGRRGCLETVASEWALVQRVSQRLGRQLEINELVALALGGDKVVRSELQKVCKYLSMALAHVVNLFDPQGVFIKGRLLDALPWLREELINRARQHSLGPPLADCRFLPASGTNLLGAVATAINAVTASRHHELDGTWVGISFPTTRC